MKILFVYPRFNRHAEDHPELRQWVPMNEYLGSPSLGIAAIAAMTPAGVELEFRDDRVTPADRPTDADLVAFSFFTPAATRAFELAHYFRAQGKTLVCGGIFPTMMPGECAPHFDAVVVGEGEGLWRTLLDDFAHQRLRPRYEEAASLCLDDLPPPRLDLYFAAERGSFQPDDYPLQLSRGCPLTCQACVLPTSMTKTLRQVPLDRVFAQLRSMVAAKKRACLTEDTSWFAGRQTHRLRDFFNRIIEEGLVAEVSYIGISMPMLLTASPELLALARRAGVSMFYLVGGFDPITMKAFTGKDQKALARAHLAIEKAHAAGIEPYTSFLIGNDDDDEGTADRMLEFAERARIAKAEFAIFTPYPGTPAWRRLEAEGRILDKRWARYNDSNVVFQPAKMSVRALEDSYLRLWREFYAPKAHYRDLPQAARTIQF
ncbi:MAG: B12-binding domain-containing radical SAM protein [Deltaproteobacteria bacterium]|nr:B12-binding domain-containing radical SAM protein [Deltaproteobacteria bacterium]